MEAQIEDLTARIVELERTIEDQKEMLRGYRNLVAIITTPEEILRAAVATLPDGMKERLRRVLGG